MHTGHDRIAAKPQPLERIRLSALLAALLAAAVLLPLLGHRPLTDWDEGIYAEIAREMLAAHTLHGWLVPHWNGHLWFEKPPLQMWLTAASLRLFGLNAFAARLPSALAGIATVTVLHRWLAHRVSALAAWLGTVLLLSAFGFQHAARAGETDTLLTLFCLVAVLGLAELLHTNARGWLLFWTGFGLALMTKGAASITLPLTALALAALQSQALLRHARAFILGLLLFLALTLPWHAFVYAHFGQAFLHDYLGLHTFTRATTAIEGHHTRPWFYLWVLLVSAPLASLLYPWAVAAPFRLQGEFRSLLALAVFALVVLVLFSAAGTRLPHYIAPAYPALSALSAALVAGWLQAGPPLTRQRALRLVCAALLLYLGDALVTARARKALHNPELRSGYTTPDNRESAALLQQLQHAPAELPGGPLLVWRQTPVVPLTTDAFYARRLARQVTTTPPPAGLAPDPYFNDPKPLAQTVPAPRLILFDTRLSPDIPPDLAVQVIVAGLSQTLAIIQPR